MPEQQRDDSNDWAAALLAGALGADVDRIRQLWQTIEAMGRAQGVASPLDPKLFRMLASKPLRDFALLELKKRGDELLQAGFRWQAPAWPRQGEKVVQATRIEIAAALSLFGANGWLDDPAAYHRTPDRAPAVALQDASWLGTRYQALSFPSRWRPASSHPGAARWRRGAGNKTVHGALLRHRGAQRPWIVCVHGYGMGTPALDFRVFDVERLYREFGLNVMTLVLPFHGARAKGSAGSSDLISTGFTNMMLCQAQAVWDLRRALRWLRKGGAEHIGVHGVSLGGNAAALLAAFEPDLEQLIVGVPALDFTHSYQSAAADEPGTAVPSRDDPLWDDLRRVFSVVSPTALPSAIEPARLALYAGQVDGVVPTRTVRGLWKHWQRPEIVWYPGGHLSFFLEEKPRELVDRRLAILADA